MREEKLSDAILYDRLNLLKRDFCGYIGRNSAKVDANPPVFFGHVVSALEKSFPELSEDAHDEFIDAITFRILDTSQNGGDPDFIRKVTTNALRVKRKKDAEAGINITIGLKLLKIGDYEGALRYLKNYWHRDALLGIAVAYCYSALALRKPAPSTTDKDIWGEGEMGLLAREKLMDLAHVQPPVNQLPQLRLDDPSFLFRIFWHMIHLGLEWFPSEKWFINVGLEQAALTKNTEIQKELLEIGSERFYNDLDFLREVYNFKLETHDAAGAAHVVSQLITQYPNELEPVYLGLKLTLLTVKKSTFHSFRKLAAAKGMPPNLLEIFDLAFALLTGEKKDALYHLAEFEREFPELHYYSDALQCIAQDFFSEDEDRVKKAKKTFFDSVDHYIAKELHTKK